VVVVAIVLALAAISFVLLHRRALVSLADGAAVARAETIADRLTVAAPDQPALEQDQHGQVTGLVAAQVLGPDGAVLASSANVVGRPSLTPLRPGPAEMLREDRFLSLSADDPFRVVALGVGTPRGDRIVVVAQSLGPAYESTESEVGLLLAGFPILLVIVGTATGLIVGRSLRAVEALRRQVAVISDKRLHERVPVPAARDEVQDLAETMNEMLDRLEGSARAQRRFVADASHELRSPLSTVQVGLELMQVRLQRQAPIEPELIETLRAESDRLEQLIADLLLLARADEHGLVGRTDEVDLDDIVDGEVRRLAGRPGLTVSVSLTPVRVRGDRDQLVRAVRNLVDNAVTHARGQVRLQLRQVDRFAEIEVSDDGPGVPATDRDRIFDRFVRLGESRQRSSGGVGLGLAIVREIVLGHGGTVSVTDAPGGGAAFRIRLPAPEPPAAS